MSETILGIELENEVVGELKAHAELVGLSVEDMLRHLLDTAHLLIDDTDAPVPTTALMLGVMETRERIRKYDERQT